MSSPERKINDLLVRIRDENNSMGGRLPPIPSTNQFVVPSPPSRHPCRRPNLPLGSLTNPSGSPVRRPHMLSITPKPKQNDNFETEEKLREIMRISGNITINGVTYKTDIKDMQEIEELGNGTCGHVIKMLHKPSKEIIAVKQMRRSGNTEESKRIIMDIEVVLKSHDCKYIVQCLGCFITEPEVWICMELMATCFDKLLKRLKQPIPEEILGKVTVATVEALSYLKDKHGVIHRDVKPSNILLDTRGNVKLCDFGISGRLVDSMAKTRSAGCVAYMAPERIEPDPDNPDYDVRADVWSLGISLVELATGVYPYKDCESDFEVLSKVIENDPPTLPADKDFSPEFRNFVSLCLTKQKKQRPKYAQLKNDPFIKKYEKLDVNVGEWFQNAVRQADAVAQAAARHTTLSLNMTSNRQYAPSVQQQHNVTTHAPPPSVLQQQQPLQHLTNGSSSMMMSRPGQHVSRLATFHNSSNHQRDGSLPPVYQKIPEQPSYSPYHAYQAHAKLINSYPQQDSPILHQQQQQQRRLPDSPLSSPYQPRRTNNSNNNSNSNCTTPTPERRWRSPSGSRNNYLQAETEQQYSSPGSTSPMMVQRFYHQQRQQQQQRDADEKDYGKKRFASYFKLQLSGDRSGRSSRNQSPDPPPRLNRSVSGDQSPLMLRRTFLETGSPASPSFSRRYISPTPPIPPPRKLSESNSVPGSPQHLRAHFHYTPEPQRRLFHNSSDVS